MRKITESEIEEVVLDILTDLGYESIFGPNIAHDGERPERSSYADVVLIERLRSAIEKLNPKIPSEAKEEAIKQILRSESPDLVINNRRFHKFLVDGVDVEFRKDGRIVGDKVWLVDFANPKNNEFLAVNQFTVIENNHNRRPDVVLFINGLPLVVIELKNPADENASTFSAFKQLGTYKAQIPSLFHFNTILVASDGIEARAGTITSNWERFLPWKTIDGIEQAPTAVPQIEVLIRGMLNPSILLDLIRHFTAFEQEQHALLKKVAAYHQYHAVNKAVESTIEAADVKGDHRCGVVWHTQGSGKSLSMVFYAGKLVLSRELENPTIVVITDRNDLDDQLFGTFSNCHELLRQTPVKVEVKKELKEKLKVASGGIIFTTIQKFLPEDKGDKFPLLSDRHNIVVIADEAHRSQYGFITGFARHMHDALPNASFIGFTGTPISKQDRDTRAVFGDEIDIYDIEQAVKDGATVRIFYESRLVKLELDENERETLDPDFEEVTEGEELSKKELLKSKWARMEAIVGSQKRINQIAHDIVDHFEKRLIAMEGKAMVVCMSRRIAVDLHDAIVKLKPQWYHQDDDKGLIKVIMTGSADDGPEWQEHIRNKERRRDIGNRMKDAVDPLKLVIVRDMWLTGFDVPCMHTMYLDKPMRGHGLMQAIARVNRVFKNKPGGLVVDYLGIAAELKEALVEYTKSGGKGKPTFKQEDAVAVMLEKYEIVSALFHGFSFKPFFNAGTKDKMSMLALAQEHILEQEDGKERCLKYVTELSQAFALAVPHKKALEIRDDIGFFQAVRACLAKFDNEGGRKTEEELDSAVKQLVSRAISSDQVVDIFATAGLERPDISILSDEFLAEVKDMPHKNLAVELLKKLLNDEIKVRERKNLIQGRSFREMLERSIREYQNKAIEAVKVIEELIELAKRMREANKRGDQLGLTEDEVAFYDALEVNDSAVKVLGDDTLRTIARELVETIRRNRTIDWTLKESIQAKLRVKVKRVLRQHGYPPDKEKQATETVLEQAKMLCKDWPESEEVVEKSDLFFSDVVQEATLEQGYLPIYDLQAVATSFAEQKSPEVIGWKPLDGMFKLNKDMFIAKVVGKSMEPTIKEGSWCLFKSDHGGSRNGKIVLVESRKVKDPETHLSYTIKRYQSQKEDLGNGQWRHKRIILSPDNKAFNEIILEKVNDEDFHVVAEFVRIVGN